MGTTNQHAIFRHLEDWTDFLVLTTKESKHFFSVKVVNTLSHSYLITENQSALLNIKLVQTC